jgi:acyl carrier protein
MTRQEEKILKIIGEYYGYECDIEDLFYENICTSDMEMSELICILENEFDFKFNFIEYPRPIDFEFIHDFIQFVTQNYPV